MSAFNILANISSVTCAPLIFALSPLYPDTCIISVLARSKNGWHPAPPRSFRWLSGTD